MWPLKCSCTFAVTVAPCSFLSCPCRIQLMRMGAVGRRDRAGTRKQNFGLRKPRSWHGTFSSVCWAHLLVGRSLFCLLVVLLSSHWDGLPSYRTVLYILYAMLDKWLNDSKLPTQQFQKSVSSYCLHSSLFERPLLRWPILLIKWMRVHSQFSIHRSRRHQQLLIYRFYSLQLKGYLFVF